MGELAGAVDEARHPLALAGADQRADLVGGVVGGVERDAGDGGGEVGDEPLVDAVGGVDAAGGGAVLAGVVVAEGAQALDHGVEVGVVEDDDRGLAAELEMGALDAGGGGLEHLPAGADVAGERDHVDGRGG